MLENIASLVKHYGQDTVINNPDIPNAANNEVLTEATHTITGGLQNMLAGGGLQDILSLFTGGNQGTGIKGLIKNPMVTMMIGHLVGKLVNKFNMNPQSASQVSNNLIPNVVNDLVNRTRDTSPVNDSFDLDDLIGSLTGGKSSPNTDGANGFNFQDLLNQFTGNAGSTHKGEGFDLENIINQVTQGAQESQAKSRSGNGLMDLIKGLVSN